MARRRLWAFTLAVPIVSVAIVFALWRWRPVFEPAARLIEEIVLHRRSHGHAYNPALYWIYPAFVGFVGLVLAALGVLALRDGRTSTRRLETYLDRRHASRATQHR
ncbi:hypothetical protein [Caulobacter endophyticus]|uniref:hypothetical protein n=1 Tax=Caulobacter endophyticus TaxID=2172652 RepID=UPI00240FED07|nr:hypothetical protein [Caulobacter endophyticus]MDG2528856.1 hypothetical protein [Caulobacter endophyticus]